MNDLKEVVKWSVLFLVALTIITVGVMALNGTLYPFLLSFQRQAVEQSKSFTDANNNMLESYILEYSRLNTKIAENGDNPEVVQAYEAQQKAIITKMCLQISTMNKNTVNPSTLQFLNSHGGCR